MDGERERGVDIVLGELDPWVAAMEGDDGGSGERVKYTTLAREPPMSTAICDTGSMWFGRYIPRLSLVSGDSSDRMTAPLVSTWMTFANGNDGLFKV